MTEKEAEEEGTSNNYKLKTKSDRERGRELRITNWGESGIEDIRLGEYTERRFPVIEHSRNVCGC